MERSIRWLDRCIEQHERSGRKDRQNLFAIVQGGLDPTLRDKCLDAMIERKDHVAGFAIGGLSGGEEKGMFYSHSRSNFRLACNVFRCVLENVRVAHTTTFALFSPSTA